MTGKPSRKTFQSRMEDMIGYLRKGIVSGEYAPGELLPSESILTEQFQLSDKSVRKGLDALVREGLIVKVERVGSIVTEAIRQSKTVINFACTGSISRDIALDKLLADFYELHPNIRINPIRIDSNYVPTVINYMEQGIADIATINHRDFTDIIDMHKAHVLDALPTHPGTLLILFTTVSESSFHASSQMAALKKSFMIVAPSSFGLWISLKRTVSLILPPVHASAISLCGGRDRARAQTGAMKTPIQNALLIPAVSPLAISV